ncbi:MAG TPA: hydantoinase B/oxoprolinase family protein [Dehalococcoidia bacterium]|nr:hydantoinase B/oxoprolinase family protein [Dehalococcoidia bacterium]
MCAQATEVRTLKDQLGENERVYMETGHLFGLRDLARKQEDPGTYEAVYQILLNICNTGWAVGCQVSSSPIAVEGGDAMWSLNLPTGECVCTSRGITGHTGMLAAFIKSLVENDYEDLPGFKPGDIFENNDPHYGDIHPMDFHTAIPIFYRDKLVSWVVSVTHGMDVGCVLPGSIGFLNPDCFSDGVPICMEKIGENDGLMPWYEKKIRSRTRVPDWIMADARARLAGAFTIRDRVIQLIDKYGLDYYEDVVREYVEDSRRYALRRLKTQAIPGRLRKSQFKDLAMKGKRVVLPKQDIDVLFNLPLDITVTSSGKLEVSFDGASSLVPFGENINPVALSSGLLNGFSHIVGFDMFSSGTTYAWETKMPPEGSWANPFPVDYHAASGVAWAPAVVWLSSLYEMMTRPFYCRGYVEEVASGAGHTLTGEFSGMGQYGVYVVGLTLEQASNGAPARAIADGETAAWCIYTPNADFGNAEVMELWYPIMYLGRSTEPDSGGYGKYRGGLGHTAVWMVKNTQSLEYQAGDAGMRTKVLANHGMYGAYPRWSDRGSYTLGSNVKELIDAQKPLVHERGDPSDPELPKRVKGEIVETNLSVPFVTPEPLREYDLVVHHVSGAHAMGDPLERDPDLVRNDLEQGWTRQRVAVEIYGVVAKLDDKSGEWAVDQAATEKRRAEMRSARIKRGIPFKDWWKKERAKVEAREGMADAVLDMWRGSMRLTPSYGAEIRAFWQLPEDFTF